ncbi:MAG: t-SNARE [Benniella sp.]|nr:MAG: t-SNARE [Benniella sp.]
MLGDQDRRRIPSPLTDFPQLTPPSSPPSYNYNQFRGFVRVDNPSPPDSGATATATTTHTFESNTNTNNDTIIHMDPETGVTFSPASSIHGTAAAVAAHTTTTTSAEDDSETTAWVTATIQDQDHDYDLMVRHVSQQIFNISSNIAVLERLIPCLGQRHKDTPEMRESLHAVLNGTQDLVKSAHALIKALSKYHHPPPAAPQSNIGLRVQPTVSPNQLTSWQRKVLAGRRQTHQRLTKDLTLASKSFQDLQRQAVEAERRQVATLKRLSVSPSLKRLTNYRSGPASPVGLNVMEMTQEESEKLPLLGGSNSVKKQNGSIVSGGASSATFDGIGLEPHNRELSVQEEALLREILILDGEVAFQETIIQEREFEIQKMEEGMGQVLDVMRELGTLVHEQRDGIDYLHDNIAQVRTRTHIAQQEVLKASEYQRRAREKLCYLIMITSIVGALVMLAFVST